MILSELLAHSSRLLELEQKSLFNAWKVSYQRSTSISTESMGRKGFQRLAERTTSEYYHSTCGEYGFETSIHLLVVRRLFINE